MTNEESAVALLLSAFGGAFISAAIGHAMDHGYRNWRVVLSGVLGAALLVAGLLWSRVASAVDEQLVHSIGRVASNFWVWLVLLLAVWLYMAITSLMLLHQRNQYGEIIKRDMNPFRLVLQRLVIPRSLTPEQIATIGSHLSKYPGYPVTYKINKNDQEAVHYGRYLQKALYQGGWSTVAIEHEAELNEGLCYTFCYTEATQRRPETPREPKPDQLLAGAFRRAQVQLTTGGTSCPPGNTQDQLTISIGPRWLDLKAQPEPWPAEYS